MQNLKSASDFGLSLLYSFFIHIYFKGNSLEKNVFKFKIHVLKKKKKNRKGESVPVLVVLIQTPV